ncbi:hypothetical protein SDC9_62175 [bioreactor metagenome]|uniref:Uncharacterized protein n=1 Tax=bioreactor metagenome TaxID=1076179 RepID=A0A644XNG7_9ZZZZ
MTEKFVAKTGITPPTKANVKPSMTVFFLPIPLTIKLLSKINISIVKEGIVTKDSTVAGAISGN